MDATSNVGSIGSSRRWRLCGNECPKAEIVFLCQVFILYTVIVVTIYTLRQGRTILGFRDNPLIGPNDGTDIVREADFVVDMSRGFESLYVYTNVVEPRVVGDSLVPLLRIVPLSGSQGDTVSKTFQKTQYVPVLCKEFGTIEIDIRDDTGRPVPFERGKVVVTLHFRRIKSRLF